MLSALVTASTAISSASTVMNFIRHFTTAMLPGRRAAPLPYSDE
jgi:hypothetical protein